MPYKVLEIYRDLPRTNCGDCGVPSCFAFATAVYLDGAAPSRCPHLSAAGAAEMAARVAQATVRARVPAPEAVRQAWADAQAGLLASDLARLAERASAAHVAGPPEALQLTLLGQPFRVVRRGNALEVTPLSGELPSPWAQVLLLLYLNRTGPAPEEGGWVSPRQFPDLLIKSGSFERAADRVAKRFGGALRELDHAAERLGGTRRYVREGAPDRAYVFLALPRVPLLLCFWDATDEFGARALLLVNESCSAYLEPEPLAFLAKALAARLLGESAATLSP